MCTVHCSPAPKTTITFMHSCIFETTSVRGHIRKIMSKAEVYNSSDFHLMMKVAYSHCCDHVDFWST